MPVLSRKQREIAERHCYFLDIARKLMHDTGFHLLSMDRVAELAEYSKGTVYQHFNCKEEMLGQLCIAALQRLQALGQRALNYEGTHRERLQVFFLAHEIWQRLEQDDVCMMQNYYTDQVLEKVSDTTKQRHAELEASIFNIVKSIVEDAMAAGDLPRGRLTAGDIVFGLWSMTHGAETLRSYNLPLNEMGVSDSGQAIVELLSCLLSGMQWKPLHHAEDPLELMQRLENEVFANELSTIKSAMNQ